jgi:signal transduction histidine kinase
VASGDAGAVLQILLNLLLNAADAVQDAPDPVVRLEVASASLRSRPPEAGGAGADSRARADAVEIRVSDNGTGIAEADRERIFDPFFTTKPPGHGTGLGLSTALRLAEEMDGQLVLSEPPPGFATCFALRLPSAAASGEGEVRRSEAAVQTASQCAGACSAGADGERSG